MVRKTIFLLILCFVSLDCAKIQPQINPNLNQQLQNSKIRDLETIQNGIKGEINGIKENADITNSKLDHVQSGLLNLQSSNSGIMIFSGPGGLLLAFAIIVTLLIIMLSYRKQAITNAKTADIFAQRVVEHNSPELEEGILKTALVTDVVTNVYSLLKKHQDIFRNTDARS